MAAGKRFQDVYAIILEVCVTSQVGQATRLLSDTGLGDTGEQLAEIRRKLVFFRA
jgi:hypothetical protein